MPACLALLSGGLDSILAARLMQEQGLAVEAVNFQSTFTSGPALAERAAALLQVPLTVIVARDDYFELVRRPQFGYGRGANPCLDCRIYFFRQAAELCRVRGLEFAVSGEVLGQRPVSQRRVDLEAIAEHSGFGARLLRPLSAKRLAPTWPEMNGLVMRERLLEIVGLGRQRQRRLARQFNLPVPESAFPGCALTELPFAKKVFDLQQHMGDTGANYELLATGRHFRYSEKVKIVVGRNAAENNTLRAHFQASGEPHLALLEPANFRGPSALITGEPHADALDFAAALVWRYAKPAGDPPLVTVITHAGSETRPARRLEAAQLARALGAN